MRKSMLLICLGGLGAIFMSPPAMAQQGEACAYQSRAYSIGFNGCFARTRLTCDAHNAWNQRGSCPASGPVGGGTPFSPGQFEGVLCSGGYSPSAEACLGGTYQQCTSAGQWREVSAPDGHPGCG
jgi:hypothetical protein